MAKLDWAALKANYLTGTLTQRDFAKAHKINPNTLMARANKEKWEDERKQRQAETSNKAVAKHEAKAVDQLVKFNEDDVRIAKALRAKAAEMLPTARTPMALRSLASTFDVAQKIGRLALGANTESAELTGKNGGPITQTTMTPEQFREIAQEVVGLV